MNPVVRIQVGALGEAETIVVPEITVRHRLPEMPAVYATPCMIYLMEIASYNAVQNLLPEGWVSVGVDVNIRHLAATPIGRKVIVRAKVTAVSDRLISFEVEAHDGVNTIGRGSHSRAPVDLKRFEAGLAKTR
jgi:predicted thioesterase